MADIYSKQVKTDPPSAIQLHYSPSATNLTSGNPLSNTSSDAFDNSVATLRTPKPIFYNTRNRSSKVRTPQTLLMQLCTSLLLLLCIGFAIDYLSPSPSYESVTESAHSSESFMPPSYPEVATAALVSFTSDTNKEEEEETITEQPVSSAAAFDTPTAPQKAVDVKAAGMATPTIVQKTSDSFEEPTLVAALDAEDIQPLPIQPRLAQFASLKPISPVLTTTTTTTTTTATTTKPKEISIPVLPKKNRLVVELNKKPDLVEHAGVLRQENIDKILKNSTLIQSELSETVSSDDDNSTDLAEEAITDVETEQIIETDVIVASSETSDVLGGMKIDCLEKTKAKAREEGKLYFLKFGAKWCLPCKVMKQTTFKDEKVKAYIADHYVPLDIDVDDFDGYNLKQLYKVTALPAFLIFNAEGNLLARFDESLSASALLHHLETYNVEENRRVEQEEMLAVSEVELPEAFDKSIDQLETLILQSRAK